VRSSAEKAGSPTEVRVATPARLPVLWLCWQPTPYNNLLFRSLSADPRLDLTVHFICPVLSSHPWQSVTPAGFSFRYFRKVCGIDWHLIKSALSDRKHMFVVAGWHDPTMQFVSLILALRRRPFLLWTDTPNVTRRRGRAKAAIRTRWLRWLFSKATTVMGTGRTALSTLEDMGCPGEKLVNLPYFVDLDVFTPSARCSADAARIYGSSGRLSDEKGYDLALQALARVYAGRLDAFVYRIAGIGPDAHLLQEKAKELGIAHRVEFLGWLEPDGLPDFYNSLDVFLHPARYEPYGVAVLEAMASGKIVIGSDAAGVVIDRIHSGINGFVHRSGDAVDLALRIEEIGRDWNNMERIRKAARVATEAWPVSRGVDLVASIAGRTLRKVEPSGAFLA